MTGGVEHTTTPVRAAMWGAIRAPLSRRTGGALVLCLLGAVLGPAVALALLLLLGIAAALSVSLVGTLPGLRLVRLLVSGAARRWGAAYRRLAALTLGQRIPAPPPPGPRAGLIAGLRDGPGWRAVAYLLLKLPLGVLQAYAAAWWLLGVADLTYPLWWGLFRNHPPGTQLQPVPVLTPLHMFHTGTFTGALGAGLGGLLMLLVAPWILAGVAQVDLALMRGLLGPESLARRLREVEESRAHAVEDTAALVRRIERDLHDGAQMRLAALALHLGRAREKLGSSDAAPDLAEARELVDTAHTGAKQALIELRQLARGIHPPALDNGLPDALTTLAAGSAIPVALTVDLPARPSPAIETIAYFCAAELLTNAAKHSRATAVELDVRPGADGVRLRVHDNGTGGADPGRGSGLSGLAHRVRAVDGRLEVNSPAGGPTEVHVHLPWRA